MVVTGVTYESYCPDMGNITITGVSSDLTLEFALSIAGTELNRWTERYTPNAQGVVVIRELGNIMMDYFKPIGLKVDYGLTVQDPINRRGVISATCNGSVLFATILYYCTQKVGISNADYNRFLGRHTTRLVRADQYVPVSYNLNGQRLAVGVAYRVADKVCYSVLNLVTEVEATQRFRTHNLSPAVIVQRINTLDKVNIKATDLIFYQAELYVSGQQVDMIRFELDHRHYKQCTHLVFYNLFGFPETLYFTGKDEKSADFAGTYALISEQYTKIDTDLHEMHTINSGYIDAATYESIKDLVRSKEVYIYQGTKMQAITITEADLTVEKPSNTPTNVKLTYRLAEDEATLFSRPSTFNDKTFDASFDHTFI